MALRRAIFWLHLLAGAVAGLVIAVMSATGVLLAFEPQLVEWSERDVRTVTPPAGAERLGLDALLAQIRQARPDARPVFVSVQAEPTAAVAFSFGRDDAVFVDPYTGRIVGRPSSLHRTLHTIEEWHRWLGSRELGRPVTGAANAAFAVLVATGFSLWWPRTWSRRAVAAVAIPGWRLRGKARDFNWHNAVGVWCAPVLLVLSLTGLVMSYQWANHLLYRLAGSEPPSFAGPAGAGRGPSGGGKPPAPPFALDPLLARAQERASARVAITLRLPAEAGAPVSAFIVEPTRWNPRARSELRLDPVTASVIAWEPHDGQSRGRRWRTWVRLLHTGEAAGVAGQAAALLASAGGVVLVWTGLALAWRRWRSWMNRPRRRGDARAPLVPRSRRRYAVAEPRGAASASNSSSFEP